LNRSVYTARGKKRTSIKRCDPAKYIQIKNCMPSKTPIGIFLAAAAALATNTIIPDNSIAGEKHGDMGGLKEWTTDQEADEDGKLDEAAQKAADKAKKADICIPIGEGENCW
jgi:hypothetical protein